MIVMAAVYILEGVVSMFALGCSEIVLFYGAPCL